MFAQGKEDEKWRQIVGEIDGGVEGAEEAVVMSDVVAEEVERGGKKPKGECTIAGYFESVEAFFFRAKGFDGDKTKDSGKK